jgi:hypothetical protein
MLDEGAGLDGGSGAVAAKGLLSFQHGDIVAKWLVDFGELTRATKRRKAGRKTRKGALS